MHNITIDATNLGPVLLVLVVSGVAGTAMAVAYFALDFGLQLGLGVMEAIAGGRASYKEPQRNKVAVFLRTLIYLALAVGAIFLSLLGYGTVAYFCAVVGGICLPIAVLKLAS